MKVFIIEDEPKIARVLAEYFERDGFAATILEEGTDAVERIQEEEPDFVVLDVMLPGKDGLTICREVRAFSAVPLLMLTARVDEIDRLLGLELGADDYVCKPFSPREVVARARTILRRTTRFQGQEQHGEGLSFQGVEVFEDRFECFVDGQEVELTPVEFRILCTMLAKVGRVFSRNQLMSAAYPDGRVVSERTIDSHLRNLRKKLSDDEREDIIRSIYGVGYKVG